MKNKDTSVLSISRTVGEAFLLDEKIEVTVTEIRGKQAWFAIVCPRDISIRRKEVVLDESIEK